MELTRTIHPIGQGGFYTETFRGNGEEVNVVYDCGGGKTGRKGESLAKKYLEKRYLKSFSGKIDAVFISHFHDDHINGLRYLLDNAAVNYLILPQLTINDVLELYLFNSFNPKTKDIAKLIIDLNGNDLYNKTRIIRVRPYEEGQVNGEVNISNDENILGIKKNVVNTGTKFYYNDWLFIPYNPPVGNKTTQGFYDYLKKELDLEDFDVNSLPSIVKKKGVDTFQKKYENFFGSNNKCKHNLYSMTLFSGLYNPFSKIKTHCINCEILKHKCLFCDNRFSFDYYKQLCNPNCLYTGDLELESDAVFDGMKSFYGSLWDEIFTIQAPHHGSSNGYHQELYKYAHRSFISVGENNGYNHPNIETLIGIKQQHCQHLIVTEHFSTIKMFNFSI